MRILVKNGRIWDGEKFFFADVLTDGEKLAKIEPNISIDADYIYNAEGKTVSAGLVDTHIHIKRLSPDEFGINAEMSCLPFGVTAACDAGSSFGDRDFLDGIGVKNVVFVGQGLNEDNPDFRFAEDLLQKYVDKAKGLKVYFDKNISDVKSIKPLEKVCAFAREKGIKVMVHCSNSPVPMAEIVSALSSGDILTHVFHGGENTCEEGNFEAFRIAKERGIIMDSGFAGHVHTDFGVLTRAISAGYLPDTISTDITKLSAYMRGGRYGMTMCMSIARSAGMREEDIFKAVTSSPARALGKGSEWGKLEVGRKADIAVLDYTDESFDLTDKAGNRIQNKKGYRCALTVSDGQVVFRD